MLISLRAIGTCFCFYTAVYLIYFFFAHLQNPILLILAAALFIACWLLTPYAYQQQSRHAYNSTMTIGTLFYNPIIFWGRLFSWPIRALLALFITD
mgnify:CR=1 FL=1